jgi:flavin reductase (DIM6/NTAB) family NADH-FMN oxidoreductase RutF
MSLPVSGRIDDETFRLGMQSLAGAVTVLTTSDRDGQFVGITATAVCSLSAEPPSLLASINMSNSLGSILRESGSFGVNILASGQQNVAETFAGFGGLFGSERFTVGEWFTASTGSPLLAGTLASFDCEVDDIVERGTHLVVFGAIVGGHIGADSSDGSTAGLPLLYHKRKFATLVG